MCAYLAQGSVKTMVVIGLAIGDFFVRNGMFPEKYSLGVKLHENFALTS